MNRAIVVSVMALLLFAAGAPAQHFGDWGTPVNLGSPVNSPYLDSCTSISKNGLSLYFASNRHTGNAGSADWDIYVSKRTDINSPWGEPVSVPNVNLTGPTDSCPALSLDEHRLYFASNRTEGCGGTDLYVSRRHDRRDDLGWGPPENLGCAPGGINSAGGEATPVVFEDEQGHVVMYVSSNRDNPANWDLYASILGHDDMFGPAVPVAEINTSNYAEQGFAVRRDGLEMIFGSNRPGGGGGGFDLWVAIRDSTDDPWSAPSPLTALNGPGTDGGKMCFSFDGRELYFRSNRSGAGDIYFVTRDKLRR